jgi:hypothetical protein
MAPAVAFEIWPEVVEQAPAAGIDCAGPPLS